MAETKKDVVNKLVESGLIDTSQKERFENLQVPDLEVITGLVDKVEGLSTALGEANASLEQIQTNAVEISETDDFKDAVKQEVDATLDKLVAEKTKELQDEIAVLKKENGNDVEEEPAPEPGIEFTYKEKKYKFKDNAPKAIRFGGVARTQDDLAKDEDALSWLVTQDSSLIQEIK